MSHPKSIEITCPTHPTYKFQNICLSESCLEPLCPECVISHVNIHKDLRTEVHLETIEKKRVESLEKLNILLNQFQKEKHKISKYSDRQKDDVYQHYINKINKSKEKLLIMIDGFFNTLYNDIRIEMDSHYNKHPEEFSLINQRIDRIILSLEKQLKNMGSNGEDSLKAMLKFQSANIHNDFNNLKKEIDDAIENYSNDLKDIIVDDSKIYTLNLELMKFVQLKPKDCSNILMEKEFLFNSLQQKAFQTNDFNTTVKINDPQLSKYSYYEGSRIKDKSMYSEINNRSGGESAKKEQLRRNFSYFFPRNANKI